MITALVKIYNCMKDQTQMVINVKEMIMHATAFALYLVSVLLMTYTNASKNGSNLLFLVMNLLWLATLFTS